MNPHLHGRPARFLMVVLALASAVGACSGGGGGGGGERTRSVKQIDAGILPTEVVGLNVQREDVAKQIKKIERPYLQGLGLFSFRKDELLQATLQISSFTEDADFESAEFRRNIANQIATGGASLPEFRVGDHAVFVTGDSRQLTAVWFRGEFMMVLVTRADYKTPRALLRALLAFDFEPQP